MERYLSVTGVRSSRYTRVHSSTLRWSIDSQRRSLGQTSPTNLLTRRPPLLRSPIQQQLSKSKRGVRRAVVTAYHAPFVVRRSAYCRTTQWM